MALCIQQIYPSIRRRKWLIQWRIPIVVRTFNGTNSGSRNTLSKERNFLCHQHAFLFIECSKCFDHFFMSLSVESPNACVNYHVLWLFSKLCFHGRSLPPSWLQMTYESKAIVLRSQHFLWGVSKFCLIWWCPICKKITPISALDSGYDHQQKLNRWQPHNRQIYSGSLVIYSAFFCNKYLSPGAIFHIPCHFVYSVKMNILKGYWNSYYE